MNRPSDVLPYQKIRPNRIGLGFLTLLLVAVGIADQAVMAQLPNQWIPDEQVPGYLSDTLTPYMVADSNRTVHAFASQWVGEPSQKLAVVYRQWTLPGGWTTPVDILLAPDGGARILDAFLDQTGTMHVIFLGGEGRATKVYHAQAPAAMASQAPAWSSPEVVGESSSDPPSGALAGDGRGNLVIIYSGNTNGNGIYEVHSSDGGDSWSEPKPIFLTLDRDHVALGLHLTLGHEEQLHAVWNVVTSQGIDISVHYARLDLAEKLWSDAVLLEERIDREGFFGPSFPAIVDTGDNVIVMYNSGNPDRGGSVPAGRPVLRAGVSSDGGLTWQESTTPFSRHLGRSGEHSLVVDSSNVAHALFMQRIETSLDGENVVLDGPWHSAFAGSRWTEPDDFPTRWSPHDLRAVVVQGNILLVTWRQDPGEGRTGVWYSYLVLDAPELPVEPLPTPQPTPTAAPLPTSTSPAPTPTPWYQLATISQEPASSAAMDSPALPLVLGLLPVALLVAGFLLAQQLHSRHRG